MKVGFFGRIFFRNSPDLNPVEHLWDILQESVFNEPMPKNRAELIQRVQKTLCSIGAEYLTSMAESLLGRAAAVRAAAGGHTKYL